MTRATGSRALRQLSSRGGEWMKGCWSSPTVVRDAKQTSLFRVSAHLYPSRNSFPLSSALNSTATERNKSLKVNGPKRSFKFMKSIRKESRPMITTDHHAQAATSSSSYPDIAADWRYKRITPHPEYFHIRIPHPLYNEFTASNYGPQKLRSVSAPCFRPSCQPSCKSQMHRSHKVRQA